MKRYAEFAITTKWSHSKMKAKPHSALWLGKLG